MTPPNNGPGDFPETTRVVYYRSTDPTISILDTQVATDTTDSGGIDAGDNDSETATVSAPSTPGNYYYGACVETPSGDSNTGNNCSIGLLVTVSRSAFDLAVGSFRVCPAGALCRDPVTVSPSQSLTLYATVDNDGTGDFLSTTTVRYYRSTNSTISSSDTEVGTDIVPAISVGDDETESLTVTAPSTTGTYYYGACVDAPSGESVTGNNCSSGVQVIVQ